MAKKKKSWNVPSTEARRAAIAAGTWSRPNSVHRRKTDYCRQKMKAETRKEANDGRGDASFLYPKISLPKTNLPYLGKETKRSRYAEKEQKENDRTGRKGDERMGMTKEEAAEYANRIMQQFGRLKNTCYLLSAGTMCGYCGIECVHNPKPERNPERNAGKKLNLTKEEAVAYGNELLKQFEVMKNRCYVLCGGSLCMICDIECRHNTHPELRK